jgi:MscS family membrane protein
MRRKDRDNANMVVMTWAARITKFMIILVGASVVLRHWDVELTAVITSIGVVGVAVGLGAQDMFKSVISGIAILSEKRFNVGDIIRTENGGYPIEGIVENIGFRSTMIRKFDKAPMFVPNNALADAAVVNFSSRLYRRIDWVLRLEYRTTASQLRYIRQEIEGYMSCSDEFVKPPEGALQVRIDKFGESSIDILIICFTNTNVWVDFMEIKERLLLKIKEVVEQSGASFAIPASSLYIEKVDRSLAPRELSPELKRKIRKEDGAKEEELDREFSFINKESI